MGESPEINRKLRRYLEEQDRPVLPLDVARELDISQATLLKDLDLMMREGYHVELHPYLGVRLFDIPDRLIDFEITEGLNSKVVGKRIFAFDNCTSTNDEAWSAIEANEANDGDVFVADSQSNARGRMGRSWSAPAGLGLYLSVVLKLKLPPDRVGVLTAAMALAVANTIEQFVHLPTELKWPNDVLVGGKKVCGVLVESRSNLPGYYVAGIGVNINHRLDDFPESLRDQATSLKLQRGKGNLHRIRLLRPLLFYLDSVTTQLRKKKYERIASAWKGFTAIEGRCVILRQGAEEFRGEVVSLDLLDGVTLKLDEGEERSFEAVKVSSIALETRSKGAPSEPEPEAA